MNTTPDGLYELLRRPWSLSSYQTEDGVFVAAIAELPEFVAAAESPAALESAVWESLSSLLSAYLAAGDEVPAPRVSVDPELSAPFVYSRRWNAARNSGTPPHGVFPVPA